MWLTDTCDDLVVVCVRERAFTSDEAAISKKYRYKATSSGMGGQGGRSVRAVGRSGGRPV